jgi:hypothetical protein
LTLRKEVVSESVDMPDFGSGRIANKPDPFYKLKMNTIDINY